MEQADIESVRLSTPDKLEDYLSGKAPQRTPVSRDSAREEMFFLGLRLNGGVDLDEIGLRFGLVGATEQTIAELCADGLLVREQNSIRLSDRGRLLSNEVFQLFLSPKERVF